MAALEASNEPFGVALEPVLDLRAAGPLKDALQQGLGRGRTLAINASAVNRMSTACLQVLIAAVIEAQKRGTAIVLKSSSPVFEAAFVAMGLTEILDAIKAQGAK